MKVGILPRQGTCNVGNMTHKVALKLVDGEKVTTVCALGLPLGIPSIIAKAKMNDRFVALNGCQIRCASLALDRIGVKDYEEITLTNDFCIEKNMRYQEETKMEEVEARVKSLISKH